MTIILSSLNPSIQPWAETPSTADVSVPPSDGGPRTLTGMAAAAYLFGQALTTIKFQDTLDGVQLTDGRFEFPPASGQWVSLSEVSNALRYKYGVDPLIEFAPGLGLRGYSVADINRILELLNREFADQFSLTLLSSAAVLAATQLANSAAGLTSAFTATDTADDTITFINDPGWTTGIPVRVSTTGGGLTAGTDYFVRNLTGGKYAFYTDQTAARAGTAGREPLTASITATVSPPPAIATTATDVDTTADTLTFFNDPGWATGLPVLVSSFDPGRTYFVRNLTGGKYAFYTDQAAAETGATGRVPLTADISTAVAPVSGYVTGNAFSNGEIYFLNDPGWATGAPVNVNPPGGGFASASIYFVRNLTGGRYDFFSTAAAAINNVSEFRVSVTPDASGTVREIMQGSVSVQRTQFFQASPDPEFPTGTVVATVIAGGGVEEGGQYYVRSQGSLGYSLYLTREAANLGGSDWVFLSRGTAATATFSLINFEGDAIDNDWLRLGGIENWPSGTRVRVSTTAGGLTAGEDYYVRNLGGNRYYFFTSQAAATGTGTTDRVDLTGEVVRDATVSPYPSRATVDGEWATFATNPTWLTGTLVRASITGGGFTAGVDYFVRDLTGGKYAFFTDRAASSRTGNAGRVNLTEGASITLSPYPSSATVESDWITFLSDPNWATGTPVQVSTTGGGLTALVDYFVRSLGSGRYEFFTSQEAAAGTSSGDSVRLTGSIGTVSRSYGGDAALSTLLNTASTPILAPATESELRQNLTEGGDLYTDRFGAYYLNGVRTQAMDVAVTSRLLVQDNVASEYKLLMDELAERNNLIAAARKVLSSGQPGLAAALSSLRQQYGFADVLSELTAGEYSDAQTDPVPTSTDPAGEFVHFDGVNPTWLTGTPVKVSANSGGLLDALTYYVRALGSGNYSLFSSQREATSAGTTGRVPLTSLVSAQFFTPFAAPSLPQVATVDTGRLFPIIGGGGNWSGWQYLAIALGSQAPDFGWATGTRIRFLEDVKVDQVVVGTTTNIFAGVDYYLRAGSANANYAGYSVYDTEEHARNTSSETGLLALGDRIPGDKIFEPNVITFATNPYWVDGTKVQANASGGGLNAGVDYYTRSLGGGRYNLFASAAQATATGSPRPAAGMVAITGEIRAAVSRVTGLIDDAQFTSITALLNTLISNKVRDGDLDQAKLQTLTAQLQNNTEAMTALIKAFTEMNAQLARAL